MPQPVIIACTGHTEEEFIQKAWRHNMDEVVGKPTNFDTLKEIMEEIIDTNIWALSWYHLFNKHSFSSSAVFIIKLFFKFNGGIISVASSKNIIIFQL